MEWLELILTAIGGSVTGLVGSIFYFRPKLKQAKADAAMKETESENFMYESLVNRINSMDELMKQQNDTIAELRGEVLRLGEEKFANEKRIVQLEAENKSLTEKVARLEKEVQEYKMRAHK